MIKPLCCEIRQGGYVLDDAKKLKLEHVLWVSYVRADAYTVFDSTINFELPPN